MHNRIEPLLLVSLDCGLLGTHVHIHSFIRSFMRAGLVRDIFGFEEHDALVENTGRLRGARVLCIAQGFARAMARHPGQRAGRAAQPGDGQDGSRLRARLRYGRASESQ